MADHPFPSSIRELFLHPVSVSNIHLNLLRCCSMSSRHISWTLHFKNMHIRGLEFLNTVSEISKSSLKSNYNWIRTVINKGSVADRIAAHTIAIQDSPVHTVHLLQNLISMVKINKKKECIMVLGKNHPVFRSWENSLFSQNTWYKARK